MIRMLSSYNSKVAPTPKLLDVLIIGGGLSGLIVAHELQHQLPSVNWNLLEAQPTLGGRLANAETTQGYIDMGGAWIWPQQQPFMKELVKKLEIKTFQQIDDSSSMRIIGGAVQLIRNIAKTLPQQRIHLETAVHKCILEEHSANDDSHSDRIIRVHTSNNRTYLTKRVVIAIPPRIMQTTIEFSPTLSAGKRHAIQQSHTWMAGVTKVALVYKSRFWSPQGSNMGLPGNGPAFQMYDSSTHDASLAAMTFFASVPTGSLALTDDKVLANQVAAQLQSAWKSHGQPDFATKAFDYNKVHVHRWPENKYISEDATPTKIQPHPQPIQSLSTTEWGNQLFFAGTETDRFSPGVMEGAVSAAHRVVTELKQILTFQH